MIMDFDDMANIVRLDDARKRRMRLLLMKERCKREGLITVKPRQSGSVPTSIDDRRIASDLRWLNGSNEEETHIIVHSDPESMPPRLKKILDELWNNNPKLREKVESEYLNLICYGNSLGPAIYKRSPWQWVESWWTIAAIGVVTAVVIWGRIEGWIP
jgi:hypothetical protein